MRRFNCCTSRQALVRDRSETDSSATCRYWPVSTVGNRLCGNNWTTVEATPTIEGHPNTAVAFNTTLTSPTVYMVLSGAYENGPNYSTGKAINGILPIASDRVSSMCDQGGRMGPPEAMDYADFDARKFLRRTLGGCLRHVSKDSVYSADSSIPFG